MMYEIGQWDFQKWGKLKLFLWNRTQNNEPNKTVIHSRNSMDKWSLPLYRSGSLWEITSEKSFSFKCTITTSFIYWDDHRKVLFFRLGGELLLYKRLNGYHERKFFNSNIIFICWSYIEYIQLVHVAFWKLNHVIMNW